MYWRQQLEYIKYNNNNTSTEFGFHQSISEFIVVVYCFNNKNQSEKFKAKKNALAITQIATYFEFHFK